MFRTRIYLPLVGYGGWLVSVNKNIQQRQNEGIESYGSAFKVSK